MDTIEANPTPPSWTILNGRVFTFRGAPRLRPTVLNASQNRYEERLIEWLLGAAVVGMLAGGGIYFLAVSPYFIRALGPLLLGT
jgi:hypothetical protein